MIGLSNFTNVSKLREITDTATIKPAVMQILINPYWNPHEYKGAIRDLGMVFEGWYPLGHGDKGLLGEPVFKGLAEKYGKSSAQIILRWHVQEGNVVFPKTMNLEHMKDNLDIFDFELTEDEMARINSLPQHCGYVVPDEAPAWVWGPNDCSKQA